eukprot:1140807-Pelagomonas_calceolata.AAC.6
MLDCVWSKKADKLSFFGRCLTGGGRLEAGSGRPFCKNRSRREAQQLAAGMVRAYMGLQECSSRNSIRCEA